MPLTNFQVWNAHQTGAINALLKLRWYSPLAGLAITRWAKSLNDDYLLIEKARADLIRSFTPNPEEGITPQDPQFREFILQFDELMKGDSHCEPYVKSIEDVLKGAKEGTDVPTLNSEEQLQLLPLFAPAA